MDSEKLQNENLYKKQIVLTRWFLFVLAFNVLLQFDFIEEAFSSKASNSTIASSISPLCGPQSSIESRKLPGVRVRFSFISIGCLSLDLKSKILGAGVLQKYKKIPHMKTLTFFHEKWASRLLTSQSSGLSPPQV